MAWKGERNRHSLAAKGVKTRYDFSVEMNTNLATKKLPNRAVISIDSEMMHGDVYDEFEFLLKLLNKRGLEVALFEVEGGYYDATFYIYDENKKDLYQLYDDYLVKEIKEAEWSEDVLDYMKEMRINPESHLQFME